MSRLPSDETLGSYFDNELPPDERQQLESLLSESPEARKVLEEFAVLQELGPMIEERMPNEMYWADLPDRVLARIASDERTEALVAEREAAPPEKAPAVSWWDRLTAPAARWATATMAVAVIGGGLYLANRDPVADTLVADATPTSEDPADATLAETPVTTHTDNPETDPESVPPLLIATNEPVDDAAEAAAYQRRVFSTLGMNGGQTSLDVGSTVPSFTGNATPVRTVSLDGSARTRAQAAIPVGTGATGAEQVLMSALRAEEAGEQALATEGFRMAARSTEANSLVRFAAEAGLIRCDWRDRLEAAGDERGKTLETLFFEAERLYRSYLQGNLADGVRARNLYSFYVQTGSTIMNEESIRYANARTKQLMACEE